tara:strand:- start:78 stop:455 length:378 start_codon:yes stop_codon:yes gene_type:complete
MKKLTLSIGLVAAILSAKAQDTSCTYFTGKEVYEFDYQMDTILSVDEQTTRFYTIKIEDNQVLCLDLSDEKNRVRKVIVKYSDGTSNVQVLKSKDNVYYTGINTVEVKVGKPYFMIGSQKPINQR